VNLQANALSGKGKTGSGGRRGVAVLPVLPEFTTPAPKNGAHQRLGPCQMLDGVLCLGDDTWVGCDDPAGVVALVSAYAPGVLSVCGAGSIRSGGDPTATLTTNPNASGPAGPTSPRGSQTRKEVS
jgi:hypothetical protein